MKFKRIELIVLTSIYLILALIIFKINKSEQEKNIWLYQAMAATVYITTVTFTQFISPGLFRKRKIESGLISTLSLLSGSWFLLSVCSYNVNYREETPFIEYFFDTPTFPITIVMFLSLFAYEILKTWIRFFITNRSFKSKIAREIFITFCVSLALGFLSLISGNHTLAAICLTFIPFGYYLFALHYYSLLPYLDKGKLNKFSYPLLSFITAAIGFIPFASIAQIISNVEENKIILLGLLISLLAISLTYMLFFNHRKQFREVFRLQRELGQTSADLKFLQSQINPHFLFNTMNTIYGIALQEKAERAAEGIYKLSNMMRFMFHENHQEYILLSREVEYLKEYVELQTLRTVTSPDIQIVCDIPDILDDYQISPMILIPFVENAFKHGISLNKPSWIRIYLTIIDNELKFSVYNSIHQSSEFDTEQKKSGIGLDNVKNRLHLLYKDRYMLNIEKTPAEFFIFLTLKFNGLGPGL